MYPFFASSSTTVRWILASLGILFHILLSNAVSLQFLTCMTYRSPHTLSSHFLQGLPPLLPRPIWPYITDFVILCLLTHTMWPKRPVLLMICYALLCFYVLTTHLFLYQYGFSSCYLLGLVHTFFLKCFFQKVCEIRIIYCHSKGLRTIDDTWSH